MTRGRKAKPTAVKKLQGTHRPDRANANEPQPPVPDSVPYAPRFLNDEGKREWRRLVGVLMEMGLYTDADRAALAMYCQSWGRWVIAERKVSELDSVVAVTDKGYSHVHAWRLEANKAMEQIKSLLGEFGLTPATRARLKVPQSAQEPSLGEQLFALVGGVVETDDGD